MIDPNIKRKADDIRTKVFGSEVRESLASGLEAMSEVVVQNTDRQGLVESQFQEVIDNTTNKDVISAPEIIAARAGEANLKQRLDKENQQVTAQLAQTAKKSEVQSLVVNKAEKSYVDENLIKKRDVSIPIGLNDTSPELLAAIEGGEGTSFNLESEPRRGSVTREKFDDATLSINLFDKTKITPSKRVNPTDGVLLDNANTHTSDFIAISPETNYSFFDFSSCAFYDVNKTFISGVNSDGTNKSVVSPANARYIRYSFWHTTLNQNMLVEGISVPATYVPHAFKLNQLRVGKDNLEFGFEYNQLGMLVSPWGYSNFDFENKKFILPHGAGGNHHVFYQNKHAVISASEAIVVDISGAGNKGIITFDTSLNQFVCKSGISIINDDEVLIAGFELRGQTATMIGQYKINGKFLSDMTSTEKECTISVAGFLWSDITFVGDELWAFRPSDYDNISEDVGAIYIFDSELQYKKRLLHNFGHVNTIDYKSETDSLIFGNGSGFYDTDGEIYIIQGVKHWKGLVDDTMLNKDSGIQGSRITKIEVFRQFGDKVNVMWGESNVNQHNICYVISNDAQNIRKLLLGKGSHEFESGQFVEGASDNQFNGSYKVLGEWVTDKIDVVQGGFYYNGYLYIAMGHGGLWMSKYKLNDDGTVVVESKREQGYNPDGTERQYYASEGAAVRNSMICHGTFGTSDVSLIYKYRVF